MAANTLLLVDGDPKVHGQIRAMFAGESIQVEVAEGREQALARIEADCPGVVLASARTVGDDGYALARDVSQNPRLRSVAVLLLLTARSADERRIQESGASGFLMKPLRPATVISRVREALLATGARSPAARSPDTPENRELDTAFDAIDAGLQGERHAEATALTRDALALIVSDAVSQAIAAYERARGQAPAPSAHTLAASSHPQTRTVQRLQHEMGLDDLSFGEGPAPAVKPGVDPRLSAEMGVTDFAFDDARAPASPGTDHIPNAEALHHAVEVVRAGMSHLSALMHAKANTPAPTEAAPAPEKPAPAKK